MQQLTHFNSNGEAHMVDVGQKKITARKASAYGEIHMMPATLTQITEQTHKKGDVLGIARIAGIMASKKTSELIPLCHSIALSHVSIHFSAHREAAYIACQVRVETQSQTGVEMEALTAVQISLLTIYDMCKAVDRGMKMTNIKLLEKSGGASGHWQANINE